MKKMSYLPRSHRLAFSLLLYFAVGLSPLRAFDWGGMRMGPYPNNDFGAGNKKGEASLGTDASAGIVSTFDNDADGWTVSNTAAVHKPSGGNPGGFLFADNPAPQESESAMVVDLSEGASTAILSGVNGTSGIALVEAYDLDASGLLNLGNISTRGSVQTGDGVIVGGEEGAASTVVVRAIAPSLEALGVANALQDPTLELHDGSGAIIATNDDWKETQQEELEATGLAPSDDREAAIQIAFEPGAYTAIVRGSGDTTGVALVEVYNLKASAAPAALPPSLTRQ